MSNDTKCITIKCDWNCCNKVFDNDWDLNAHLAEHVRAYALIDATEFICLWYDCDYVLRDIQHTARHLYYHGYYAGLLEHGKLELSTQNDLPTCKAVRRDNLIPPLDKPFKCEWQDCDSLFESIIEFQDHMVKHVQFEFEYSKNPYDARTKPQCYWNCCKKVFINKYRLLEHVQTHSYKKKVACPQCGETFRTRATLFDHLRRQPDKDTPQDYQCAQCFKSFVTENLLRTHMGKHINCHKCSLCDMTCSSLSSLAVHVRYRHLQDKPMKCTECDYRCVRQNDLQKHMQYMHIKHMYRCPHEGCHYAVLSASLLKRHEQEVHNDNPYIYICHCCDQAFKSGRSLSYHLMKKHNFQLFSGHKRFKYCMDRDGYYRLEIKRLESLEVSNQILGTPHPHEVPSSHIDKFEIATIKHEPPLDIMDEYSDMDTVEGADIIISLPNNRSTDNSDK